MVFGPKPIKETKKVLQKEILAILEKVQAIVGSHQAGAGQRKSELAQKGVSPKTDAEPRTERVSITEFNDTEDKVAPPEHLNTKRQSPEPFKITSQEKAQS